MVPGILPMNIAARSYVSPALIAARGVALATASVTGSVNFVIACAKEIASRPSRCQSRVHPVLTKSAVKLFLRQSVIANTPPRIGIHNGIAGGIFKPKIIPVTRALPSLMITPAAHQCLKKVLTEYTGKNRCNNNDKGIDTELHLAFRS